ncbi:DUF1365 domain-containing protein [Ideonella sp. DXS29W]|uniref:DUF1365 domain-containing protein n=1 Tax=Ideonella lacteola TaxID=2984193 RepID=A0ABU9BLR1_9BURK
MPSPRTNDASAATARPLIGVGEVRHARLRPHRHAFSYPAFYWMLPLRALRTRPEAVVRRGRFGWASFDDRDHGDGRADCLAWFDELLVREGVTDADGEVWLHCLPRMLGHVFKPVSFWFAHRADGSLAAILAEVNNTFGERHCYLLTGPKLGWGQELQATKVFHVSPFCRTEGRYRFRFMRTDQRQVVRVDLDGTDGPLITTSISGHLQPLTAASLRTTLWRLPLQSLAVVARIHWHALQLWWRGVPFNRKPEPPAQTVSTGSPTRLSEPAA